MLVGRGPAQPDGWAWRWRQSVDLGGRPVNFFRHFSPISTPTRFIMNTYLITLSECANRALIFSVSGDIIEIQFSHGLYL